MTILSIPLPPAPAKELRGDEDLQFVQGFFFMAVEGAMT